MAVRCGRSSDEVGREPAIVTLCVAVGVVPDPSVDNRRWYARRIEIVVSYPWFTNVQRRPAR